MTPSTSLAWVRGVYLLALVALLPGCYDWDRFRFVSDAAQDGGVDASSDAGVDAPSDAGVDAPSDAAIDARLDARIPRFCERFERIDAGVYTCDDFETTRTRNAGVSGGGACSVTRNPDGTSSYTCTAPGPMAVGTTSHARLRIGPHSLTGGRTWFIRFSMRWAAESAPSEASIFSIIGAPSETNIALRRDGTLRLSYGAREVSSSAPGLFQESQCHLFRMDVSDTTGRLTFIPGDGSGALTVGADATGVGGLDTQIPSTSTVEIALGIFANRHRDDFFPPSGLVSVVLDDFVFSRFAIPCD